MIYIYVLLERLGTQDVSHSRDSSCNRITNTVQGDHINNINQNYILIQYSAPLTCLFKKILAYSYPTS